MLCHYSTVNPVEFSKLEKVSQTGFYDFRTYSLLEILINTLIDGRCSGANTTDAHRLLDALLQNKTAQTTEGPKRQIYHLHGLVYLKEQQATLALHSFRNSQYYWPDVEAGLLQISLLAENGMFTEALKLLKVIRENFQSNKKKLSYQQKINFTNEMAKLEKLLMVDQEKINNPRDQQLRLPP
jgi:flagellar biosynthesis regulator FlbT